MSAPCLGGWGSESDDSLLGWWHQYGLLQQAGFYPDAARRGALRELRRRGLPVREIDTGYRWCPISGAYLPTGRGDPPRSARPRGHLWTPEGGICGHGYYPFWGIGGRSGLGPGRLP